MTKNQKTQDQATAQTVDLDTQVSKRIFVLKEDVNFFGTEIKAGTVYKHYKSSKDMFRCFRDEGGIIMECPQFDLSFMIVINNPLFISSFIC